MRPERNPIKWVDEWPLPGLSPEDRLSIKGHLLEAHALFHRIDDYSKPMQQAFDRIAGVLFESGLLTSEVLNKQLSLFIFESALAADWYFWGPREDRTEIFPGYLGNATAWKEFTDNLPRMFLAEISEWTGKLLHREAAEIKSARGMPQKDVSKEIERRARLLDEYKAATKHPSSKRIYEAKNSGIHKPEFYQWVNGILSADSATAKNFERFLREKKSPIPRNPKH
jgi:hypothetical protein